MEFRYGTADEPPPPPLRYQEPPPAKNSYFTEQDIRAGYRRPGFGLGDEYFSQGFEQANEYCGQGIGEANECFWNEIYIREAIQRKIEKERIREEIIAAEIARRQVLEAEVRAEMSIERELALRAREGSAFDRFSFPVGAGMGLEPSEIAFPLEVKGLSLEEGSAMSAEERIGLRARLETQRFETVPFQRGSANPKIKEVVPSPSGVGNEKEKIVFLAKPNTHLAGAKWKAVSPAEESANELLSFRATNKKVQEEWNCAICQVRASSESGLYEHIQGKKHKSKEDAFMARMSGNNIGIGVSPKKTVKPILEVTRVLSSDKGLKLGEEVLHTNQSGQSSLHVVSNKKVKEEWNCAICQVRASSESCLYEHIQGKKHKSKEDAFMARMSGNNIGIGVSPKKTVKPILEVTRVLSSDKGLKLGEEVLHTNQSGQSSLHVVSNKKVKEEWNCAICQVRASSESCLYDHIQGKKHKSKEDAFMAGMSGNNIGIGVSPKKTVKPILEVTRVLSSDKGLKLGEEVLHTNQSGQSSLHVVSNKKVKEEWNCAICQVRASSESCLYDHIQGKKHKSKEDAFMARMSGNNIGIGVSPKKTVKPILEVTRVLSSDKGLKLGEEVLHTNQSGQSSLHVVSNKKVKEEWNCAICQVRASSESGLYDHIQGKKHKSKEDAFMARMSSDKGLKLGEEVLHTNQNGQSSLHVVSTTECLDKKNVSMLQESEKIGKLKKKNLVQVQKVPNNGQKKMEEFTFWCEMCQVGTYSANVMEGHMKGKKHSTRLQKAKENGQAIPTLQIVGIQGANDSDEATKKRENENFENVVRTVNEKDIGNDDVTANKEEEVLHNNQSKQSSLHIVSATECLDKKNVSMSQESEEIGKKLRKMVKLFPPFRLWAFRE